MPIIIITFIIGLLLFLLPFYLKTFLRNKFPAKRKSYWLAGSYFLLFSFLYSAVITKLSESIFTLPNYLLAGIIALIIALFTELGRFFLLDKIIKVREKNELIEFGAGYLSLSTILVAVLLIMSTFVHVYFSKNPDLSVDFASLGKTEFENIKMLQELSVGYLQKNPLIALIPLIERAAEYLLSLYCTFLIAFGLIKNKQSKIWLAILIKALFLFLLFLKPFGGNEDWNELVNVLLQIIVIVVLSVPLKKWIIDEKSEKIKE
jgi:hypothetical protein